jgi:hypothetical protein
MKTPGALGLHVPAPGDNGWADLMNENLGKIDEGITSINNDLVAQAGNIETQLAARSAEIATSMAAANASFAEIAEAVKADLVTQLKIYIDTLLGGVAVTASGNMSAVMSSIQSEKARLDAAEALINTSFANQEQKIITDWAALDTQLGGLGSAAAEMAATLTAELNLLASGMASHLTSTGNPHRVTFQQVGGSAALRYVADSTKDKRYI